MKKIFILFIIALLSLSMGVYAKEGDCGYEGGISGQNTSTKSTQDLEYQETVFITGQPIVFKGKVTIKKKISNNQETTTYTYALSDLDKNTLKRTINLLTKLTTKENNQIVKETTITGKPTETIVIENKTYTLDSYSLTKSSLSDNKPAVNYFAGSFEGKKVYSTIAGSNTANIIVSSKGQFYGYDQNWSNSEIQIVDLFIENSETKNNWSGTAKIKLSSIMATNFKYNKNFPEEISFDGGYVQSQNIVSKLNYESNLPQFDKNGKATDKIISKSGNLNYDTFPNEKRLASYDLVNIRGHWAEEDIKKLYGLEIFADSPTLFLPNQYISRAEFAKALAKTINLPIASTNSKTKTKVSTPYEDVPVTDQYFPYIQAVTAKGAMEGFGDGKFYPYEPLSRVQAIATFIRALGLKSMSQNEYPVTGFKDNDIIPSWALRTIDVGVKIGLVQGDNGYFRPNQYMTKAEAATFINRFIDYMRRDLPKSYSDKILNY